MSRLLTLASFVLAFAGLNLRAEQPNVVLLFIDDLGYGDTGPFGCEDIPTPHLDRLAEEGVVFTQSYITNPPCCPSRCSLIMGMYGQHFGKYGMSRGLAIPEDKPTLGEFMRDHGYVTGQVGKWDIGTAFQTPSARGFMEVAQRPPSVNNSRFLCERKDGSTAWLTEIDGDQMIDFIDRHKDEPFFLYWSPDAVHSPHKDIPKELSDRTTAKGIRRKLGGGIVSVDDQLGKLLDYLDKNQLRENTLVIFSSDNGANSGEGGTSTPYRGGKGKATQQIGWTLIPTVMSWPGTIAKGERYDGLSCTLDFYATIASAIGKKGPAHLDGVDLLPFAKGEKEGDAHEFIYWLNNEPDDAVRRWLVAVRWKHWRLYKYKEEDEWQLFDLEKDPKEEHDVAKNHPEVVERLGRKHAEWQKTHVPHGKIPDLPRAKRLTSPGYGWLVSDGKLRPEPATEKKDAQ